MKGFLLDTNVISELRKGNRTDPNVLAWLQTTGEDELFLSVLVLGEVRAGIEAKRAKDPAQACALERWLHGLEAMYSDRIVPVTASIADKWGRLSVARAPSVIDGLMAATALDHDFTLVTRNVHDMKRTGVMLLNPFERAAK